MLTKLKELLKSTYFPANQYKDYAINVESISHVYLDSISASNREQIKTRYKFPEAIINKLMAVLYSNHVSVYERIEC
jgi:tRNA A37 threonylcarbamoyladenosine dehydratase